MSEAAYSHTFYVVEHNSLFHWGFSGILTSGGYKIVGNRKFAVSITIWYFDGFFVFFLTF